MKFIQELENLKAKRTYLLKVAHILPKDIVKQQVNALELEIVKLRSQQMFGSAMVNEVISWR